MTWNIISGRLRPPRSEVCVQNSKAVKRSVRSVSLANPSPHYQLRTTKMDTCLIAIKEIEWTGNTLQSPPLILMNEEIFEILNHLFIFGAIVPFVWDPLILVFAL